MADDDGSGVIRYSVKEVLERLERKIDTYAGLLGSKADRSDVERLADRLEAVQGRVHVLETGREAERVHAERTTDYRRWMLPTIAAVVLAAATVASLFGVHL